MKRFFIKIKWYIISLFWIPVRCSECGKVIKRGKYYSGMRCKNCKDAREKTVKRIMDILEKYKDCDIYVDDGYGNKLNLITHIIYMIGWLR